MNILVGIAAVAFGIGAAMSGGATYWVQSVKLKHAELTIRKLEQSIELANGLAEHQAVQAADRISSLESDLAQSLKQRRVEYVERIKEIRVVASPTRQCFSHAVVGVLNDASRGAQGQGAGSAAAAPAAPAADPPGPRRAASEQAVAGYVVKAIAQDNEWRDKFLALADVVRTLPCVKVE